MEEWRTIPDLDGNYLASNEGRIKRISYVSISVMKNGHIRKSVLPEKILVGKKLSPKGYKRINLLGKVEFVHCLIALTFLGKKPKDMQVNHIDGNKLNNHINNLEYVTNQQNRDHAVKLNLHPNRTNGMGMPIEKCFIAFDMYNTERISQKKIGMRFGVCQQTIQKIFKQIRAGLITRQIP